MALAQRPASRFYAAFYRWSRHTQRPSPCALSSQGLHLSRQPATLANLRSYHATHRLLEKDQSSLDFAEELERRPSAGQEDSQASDRPLSRANDPTQLKDNVRSLMRMVPASVAVITVAHVDPETEESVPMGIAVSSLSTVTLDPPTVSFNIKQPSKTLNAIRDAHGSFRVHFLASDPEGLQIIEHFCKGNHPDAYKERLKSLSISLPQAEAGPATTAALAPQIRGNGVRAAFECNLTHELPVADHVILVAQVKSIETGDLRVPTMAYVNGSYQRLHKKGLIKRHENERNPKQPIAEQQYDTSENTYGLSKSSLPMNPQQELAMAYDWPVIPGEEQRHQLAERLRSYFKGLQGLRFVNQRDVSRQLQVSLKMVARQIGVDVVALIQECQKGSSNQQVLPEFYSRLSASKMAKLVDRMKQLVKTDKRFLEVSYLDLLHYLDVSVSNTDVLPSDLLEPLRAEGLVPPVKPSAPLLSTDSIDRNVLVMEQVEHALREDAIRRWEHAPQSRPSLREIANKADVPIEDMVYFSHTRLMCDINPYASVNAQLDITGHVSPEEGLVVIRRIAEHMVLNADARYTHSQNLLRSEAVILRDISVHPLVTGVNAEFVIGKIRYLHILNKQGLPALKRQIEEWLEPYFARTVKWNDLNARITQFVQKLPLRATSWNNRDILAAMGLSENTIIDTPITETPKTLQQSMLLNMLLAKALKDHYGNGTEEENQAIAKFLMNKYKFDVTRKSAQISPEEIQRRSSADDLEAARKQHEAETIPIQDDAELQKQQEGYKPYNQPRLRKHGSLVAARTTKIGRLHKSNPEPSASKDRQ